MKKSALTIFLLLVIVCSLVLINAIQSGRAQSGTNVNGVLTTNTTWTQAGSPYTFTGPVAVYAGVTLTIQPGVTINMGSNTLQVNGTLVAIGTSTNYIEINGGGQSFAVIDFTSVSNGWSEQTNSGSIIQYANVTGASIGLESPAKIDHNILSGNILMSSVVGGTCGVISNNFVTASYGNGIGVGGNASVVNNIVTGAVWGGIDIVSGSPTIQGNLVIGNMGWNGVMPQGGIVIQNGNNYANIQITPEIQYNTITNNNAGITLADPASGQNIQPVITNNNIYGNQKYNVYLNQLYYNVSLANNWWGITGTQAINQTIYDYKDNYNLGNVTFVPFLTAPNNQAPTYINATAGTGGSISPSGVISANYGGSQSFTITPNNGYYISAVLVNGTSVGAVSTYNIQNVNGATTISAAFALTPAPTPSPTATPTSTTTSTPAPSPTGGPNSTPTSTPTSTPAVPEFSWLAMLPLFLSMLSIAVMLRHRKTA